MDAYLAVVGKREVRRYESRPVPDAVLTQILEAGRASGSSRNRQPWRFIVLTDRAQLREVSALVSRPANVADAPAAIVVAIASPRAAFDAGRTAPRTSCWPPGRWGSARVRIRLPMRPP